MVTPKKLRHTEKWRKLAAIPGFKSAVQGLYHKTPSNIGKINALFRKLRFQSEHPERFTTVRAIAKSSKKNLRGNPSSGNRYVIPLLGFDRARIVHGRVVREITKPAGYERLIIRARQIVGPGDDILTRIRALDPARYSRGKGNLMVQIGDRAPFRLVGFEKGSNAVESAARAIEFYQWHDSRGLNHLEHYMSIVWYERKPL